MSIPANNTKILEVKNLTNHYLGQKLLDDVNLSLVKGEILCLLGPSGSGKTTLLRLIAGLEQETSGEVMFNGRNILKVAPHKRNIGMMFQEYALFPHKSVSQNISFGLEMKKCSTNHQENVIKSMLELVGLTGFGDRKVDELSGGERQRVALARSLAPEPDLLLLDEPLGSLDRILRERLTIEIRSILKKIGVTAVFVTHDQAEAFSVADKVAILQDGRLQQIETPENVYRFPANRDVAEFLGFTNFIDGQVTENGNFVCGVSGVKNLLLNAEKWAGDHTLLIRPEGACVCENGDVETVQPTVSGRVVLSRFQGSTYKVVVDAGGQECIFDLPLEPKPPVPGEHIDLVLQPSSILLLRSKKRLENI